MTTLIQSQDKDLQLPKDKEVIKNKWSEVIKTTLLIHKLGKRTGDGEQELALSPLEVRYCASRSC